MGEWFESSLVALGVVLIIVVITTLFLGVLWLLTMLPEYAVAIILFLFVWGALTVAVHSGGR